MLIRSDTLKPWAGEPLPRNDDFIHHPANIEQLWSESALAEWGLFKVVPFVIPDNHVIMSEVSYQFNDGVMYEVYFTEPMPIPPPIPASKRVVEKTTIVNRLYEAGLLDVAVDTIRADYLLNERWYASGKPFVYYDDPATVALLESIGADVDEILGE